VKVKVVTKWVQAIGKEPLTHDAERRRQEAEQRVRLDIPKDEVEAHDLQWKAGLAVDWSKDVK
jgi:hypothetical protein